MKDKSTLKTILLLTVVSFLTSFGHLKAQIANSYPFDSLINNDPNVIFTEMFEQSTVPIMLSTPGYQTMTSLSRINLDPSVPAGSHGLQSLMLTTVEHSNASNDTMEDANIRINLPTAITDSVFIRYYVKYNSGHTFHHSGVWAGGTNPSHNCWTCVYPGRYIPVSGDSAFIVGTEIRGSATQSAVTTSQFGFYNYWMGMKPYLTGSNAGKYYGNEFNSLGSNDIINMDSWNCIEMMIKLNNPVSDSTGELKLWINGNLIGYYGKGFPTGTWNEATFVEGTGTPFEGFRWRSNSNVVFNYLWLKNYATQNNLYPTQNDMWIDHVVVAKSYIGPISTNLSTGINEPNASKTISMYPNPANEIVKFSKTIKDVAVLNVFGQIVLQAKNTASISTEGLQEGLYVIQADKTIHKIIIRH
jgi:hypothetical protein